MPALPRPANRPLSLWPVNNETLVSVIDKFLIELADGSDLDNMPSRLGITAGLYDYMTTRLQRLGYIQPVGASWQLTGKSRGGI